MALLAHRLPQLRTIGRMDRRLRVALLAVLGTALVSSAEAQIIIGGAQRHTGNDAANMPAFGDAYSDAEIASVANFVTARFGTKGSELTAAHIAKLRTQD